MFNIIRGDTLIIDVVFTRNNLPVDLSGATIFSTFKRNVSDASALITKSLSSGIVIVNLVNGLAQIQVDPVDTVDVLDEPLLVFDVELNESTGRVSTVRDTLKIRQDITKG